MGSTFRTVNLVVSAIMVIFGIIVIVSGRGESGAQASMPLAIGIILVVYGVTRFILYSRSGRPDR